MSETKPYDLLEPGSQDMPLEFGVTATKAVSARSLFSIAVSLRKITKILEAGHELPSGSPSATDKA